MALPDKRLSLLLIDDDPNMLLITQWALRRDPKIDVRPLSRATAALDMLRDRSWRPDLVLTDISMPDLDGFKLLEAIAALPPETRVPVIFLTGRDRPDDVARMKSAGALDVIFKPFAPEALAAHVRAAWDAAASGA